MTKNSELTTRKSNKFLWVLIRKIRDLKPVAEKARPGEFGKALAGLENLCLELTRQKEMEGR